MDQLITTSQSLLAALGGGGGPPEAKGPHRVGEKTRMIIDLREI